MLLERVKGQKSDCRRYKSQKIQKDTKDTKDTKAVEWSSLQDTLPSGLFCLSNSVLQVIQELLDVVDIILYLVLFWASEEKTLKGSRRASSPTFPGHWIRSPQEQLEFIVFQCIFFAASLISRRFTAVNACLYSHTVLRFFLSWFGNWQWWIMLSYP